MQKQCLKIETKTTTTTIKKNWFKESSEKRAKWFYFFSEIMKIRKVSKSIVWFYLTIFIAYKFYKCSFVFTINVNTLHNISLFCVFISYICLKGEHWTLYFPLCWTLWRISLYLLLVLAEVSLLLHIFRLFSFFKITKKKVFVQWSTCASILTFFVVSRSNSQIEFLNTVLLMCARL